MATVVTRKLNLFISGRANLGDGAVEVLLQFPANGVQLQPHLFDLVFARSGPPRPRRKHCSCCNRRLYKCSAFHSVFLSSWTGGGSIQKTDGHYLKKRAALTKKAPPSSFQFPLEVEPQPKLHDSRIVRCIQMQECASSEGRAYAVVLGVVKEVVVLPAKFETGPLVDGEPLEGPEVEVNASGQSERVAPHVSERQADGHRKRCRVVGERPAVRRILIGCETRFGVTGQIGARPARVVDRYGVGD